MEISLRCDSEGDADKKNVPIEGVSGHALSDDGENHGELVGDEAPTPQVIFGVEHFVMPEGGEPDAVQVETPDHHLGVVPGGSR